MRAENVVASCNRLVARPSPPFRIFGDNGNEFSGCLFDQWAHDHGVWIALSLPGIPAVDHLV